MRIAIFGAGGVGGYFGARLAAAGNEVAFVARGAHLAAIREHGLRVRSPFGDVHIHPASATDDTETIGPVDFVLFATKLYDTQAAAGTCRPLVGAETAVICLQNGVDGEAWLARVLGEAHVAGGVARISASIAAPGVIEHHADFASISVGEVYATHSARLERLVAAAKEAGIDARVSSNIRGEIWEKFVFLASMAAMTSLTRLPIGPIRELPATWSMLEDAVREAVAVARALEVPVREDVFDRVIGFLRSLPSDMKASMLVDLEQGKPLEVEWLSGTVCRLGAEHGIETPVHRAALGALLPYAGGKLRLRASDPEPNRE